MDYTQEIKEIKEELKSLDVGHLGQVAGENEPKTAEQKRKIVLLGAYEELQRIKKISEDIQKAEENDEEEPREREEHEEHREPLSIEKEEIFKILLSWGGGSDGFKLFFKDDELIRGVYFMADWGEYQEQDLNDEEAEEIYNYYLYGDITAYKQ
jgi:CO dehydrogenase/acetyl-CoA synthase beta subunit